MRTLIAVVFIAVYAFSGFNNSTQAQNLATWDFELQTPAPAFVATYMTANPAAFGPNQTSVQFFTGNGSLWAYSATPWPTGVMDTNSYLEVMIAPEAEYMFDLLAFHFEHRRSATGVRAWELRTSADGFTAPLASGVIADNTNFNYVDVPLPAEFQDIVSSLTFRIYGFNAEATAGTWRFDNIFITGTAEEIPVIPVAHWALLLGGLLMIIFVILRFRK